LNFTGLQIPVCCIRASMFIAMIAGLNPSGGSELTFCSDICFSLWEVAVHERSLSLPVWCVTLCSPLKGLGMRYRNLFYFICSCFAGDIRNVSTHQQPGSGGNVQ
jgi:hypothetical protein